MRGRYTFIFLLIAVSTLYSCDENVLVEAPPKFNRPIHKKVFTVENKVVLAEEFMYETISSDNPKLIKYRREGASLMGVTQEEFTYKLDTNNRLISVQVRIQKNGNSTEVVNKVISYNENDQLLRVAETRGDTLYNALLRYDIFGNLIQIIKNKVENGFQRIDLNRRSFNWNKVNVVNSETIANGIVSSMSYGFDTNINPIAKYMPEDYRIIIGDEINLSRNNVTDILDNSTQLRYRYMYQYGLDRMPLHAIVEKFVNNTWVKHGEVKYEYY